MESLKEATRRKLHVSLHSKRKQLSLENASRPKSEHHGKFSPNCGFIKRKVQYRLLIDDGGVLTSIEQVQNDTSCRMQTQINEYLFPRSCGHGNVETYGHGPTLLMITKLAVKCCPVIKSDTLVLL